MNNNEKVASKLRRWEKYLVNYNLPEWESIPDLGLYMEQVISLLTGYLDYLPPDIKDEQYITPSIINNYVRNKYIPQPIKKKYYRAHIAYLIIICTLKQTISISMIQKVIPNGLSEEEIKEIYKSFVKRHKAVSEFFLNSVRSVVSPMIEPEELKKENQPDIAFNIIMDSALAGNFSKLLAEKLILIKEQPKD